LGLSRWPQVRYRAEGRSERTEKPGKVQEESPDGDSGFKQSHRTAGRKEVKSKETVRGF